MNSHTNPMKFPRPGARRRRFRPFLQGSLAAVVAVLGVGSSPRPRPLTATNVTGVASCPSGATQTITWTIRQ